MNSTSTTVCTFPNSSKRRYQISQPCEEAGTASKDLWNTSDFIPRRQWPLRRDLQQPFPPRAHCDSPSPCKATPTQREFHTRVPRQNLPVKSEANRTAFAISTFLKMSWACHDSKMGWIQVPCWLWCASPGGKQVLSTSSFSYQNSFVLHYQNDTIFNFSLDCS